MTRLNGQPRVLVRDSESQSLRALRAVLRGAGFDVHLTGTAEEALDGAALSTPDAVIVEMLLPDGAGADDYVLKPFAPRELIARLHAILRRAKLGSHRPILEFRGGHIDLAARVVRSPGREIRLTPIECRLLEASLANRGRLITHDALLRQAWGTAHAEDRQTLRVHMANLRRSFGQPKNIRSSTLRAHDSITEGLMV